MADQHALFAVVADDNNEVKTYRVSRWMRWSEAISLHEDTEFLRQDGRMEFAVNGEEVRYLAVRSDDDGTWAGLPEGKLHKITSATFAGQRFRKVSPDTYVNGQYRIERDSLESECCGAHPVKLTAELREFIRNDDREAWFPSEAHEAVRMGRKGYHCHGEEIHFRQEWVAFNIETDQQGPWDLSPTGAFDMLLDDEKRRANGYR